MTSHRNKEILRAPVKKSLIHGRLLSAPPGDIDGGWGKWGNGYEWDG